MSQSVLLLALFANLGGALRLHAETIVVGRDGSITIPAVTIGETAGPIQLRFGLPVTPSRQERTSGRVLHSVWVTNGIRYRQTILLHKGKLRPDQNSPTQPILLINLEGENISGDYAEASARLVLESGKRPQALSLRDGSIWSRMENTERWLGVLEVPSSGIKLAQGSALEFAGAIPPSLNGSMTLKIPLPGFSGSVAVEELSELEFDRALRRAQSLGTDEGSGSEPFAMTFAAERELGFLQRQADEDRANMPEWWPSAPPLPPPAGQVRRVTTVDELLHAAESAASGETILVEEGRYSMPRVLVLRGRQQITIRGASGNPDKVILTGRGWDSGMEHDDIVHITACSGVTLADLTLADCHSYGIKVESESSPQDIHIYHCRFRDIGVRAIKGSAGQDLNNRATRGSVRYCRFENTRIPPPEWSFGGDYISAIDMMALQSWTFSDNFFRNIRGQTGGARAAVFIWVRSRDIIVERNMFVDCDRGIAFGNPGKTTAATPDERVRHVDQGVICNNMIAGGSDCGIELWSVEHTRVLHNSIWRPEQNWSRGIRVGAGTIDAEIRNNLVHGEISFEGGTARLEHNLSGRWDHYFEKPPAGDLSLRANAVRAIDQGEFLEAVPLDIRGQGRSPRPDIGAWEFRKE